MAHITRSLAFLVAFLAAAPLSFSADKFDRDKGKGPDKEVRQRGPEQVPGRSEQREAPRPEEVRGPSRSEERPSVSVDRPKEDRKERSSGRPEARPVERRSEERRASVPEPPREIRRNEPEPRREVPEVKREEPSRDRSYESGARSIRSRNEEPRRIESAEPKKGESKKSEFTRESPSPRAGSPVVRESERGRGNSKSEPQPRLEARERPEPKVERKEVAPPEIKRDVEKGRSSEDRGRSFRPEPVQKAKEEVAERQAPKVEKADRPEAAEPSREVFGKSGQKRLEIKPRDEAKPAQQQDVAKPSDKSDRSDRLDRSDEPAREDRKVFGRSTGTDDKRLEAKPAEETKEPGPQVIRKGEVARNQDKVDRTERKSDDAEVKKDFESSRDKRTFKPAKPAVEPPELAAPKEDKAPAAPDRGKSFGERKPEQPTETTTVTTDEPKPQPQVTDTAKDTDRQQRGFGSREGRDARGGDEAQREFRVDTERLGSQPPQDAQVTLNKPNPRSPKELKERVNRFARDDQRFQKNVQVAEKVLAEEKTVATKEYRAEKTEVVADLYQRQDRDRQEVITTLDQRKGDLQDRMQVKKSLFNRYGGFDFSERDGDRGRDGDRDWGRDRDRDHDDRWDGHRDWDGHRRDRDWWHDRRHRDWDWDDDGNIFINIDIDLNVRHVHGDHCGHYYYDNYWHDYPRTFDFVTAGLFFHSGGWYDYPQTHHHYDGCGHFHDGDRWLSYAGYHHRHHHGCGHYYWGGIWQDYPIYHVHFAGCGHHYYDGYWHRFPVAHVHSTTCGHFYDGAIWHVYGYDRHVHGEGCGHYHYRDRWYVYPETYYAYRPRSEFYFFVNMGDYEYRRVPRYVYEEVRYVTTTVEPQPVVEEVVEEVKVFEDTDPLSRAYAEFAQEDFFSSIIHFSDAIDRDPEEGLNYLARAQAFVAVGDYAAAYDDIIAGMERIPDWPDVLLNLTEIYGNPETFSQHLKFMEEWVANHPQDYKAHFVLGYTYFFIQDFDRAKYELVYALAEQPDHVQALRLLDEIYERQAEAQTQAATETAQQ